MEIIVSRICLSHPVTNEIKSVCTCIEGGKDLRQLLDFQEAYDGLFEASLTLSPERMDQSDSNKLLIELATLDHWPFNLLRHLEEKNFQVVAHIHEQHGNVLRFYANGEIFKAPSPSANGKLFSIEHREQVDDLLQYRGGLEAAALIVPSNNRITKKIGSENNIAGYITR